MFKKFFSIFFVLWLEIFISAFGSFDMHIFSVGAANFVLFRFQSEEQQYNLVVDAGYDRECHVFEELNEYVNKESIVNAALELMGEAPTTIVISHLDIDHYNLLEMLTGVINIEQLIIGRSPTNEKMFPFDAIGIENVLRGENANPNLIQKCLGDGVDVKILIPENNFTQVNDDNDESLVIYLEVFGRRILMCGDASLNLLAQIKATYGLDNIDILVPSHHLSIKEGLGGAPDLFKAKLCIGSTRPHQQYHFPGSFWTGVSFSWSESVLVEPHCLTCCCKGELVSYSVKTPIFSTFDSRSLYYKVIIEDGGTINLFDDKSNRFFASCSLEQDEDLWILFNQRHISLKNQLYKLQSMGLEESFLKHILNRMIDIWGASSYRAAMALGSLASAIEANPEFLEAVNEFIQQLYGKAAEGFGDQAVIQAVAPLWKALAIVQPSVMVDLLGIGIEAFQSNPILASTALREFAPAIEANPEFLETVNGFVQQLYGKAAEGFCDQAVIQAVAPLIEMLARLSQFDIFVWFIQNIFVQQPHPYLAAVALRGLASAINANPEFLGVVSEFIPSLYKVAAAGFDNQEVIQAVAPLIETIRPFSEQNQIIKDIVTDFDSHHQEEET